MGSPNQRPHDQDLALVTGRVGATLRGDHQWGYLFRGEDELVVVRRGPWWQTPTYPLQRWAFVPIASIERVDWRRLHQTGELAPPPGTPADEPSRDAARPASRTEWHAAPGSVRLK